MSNNMILICIIILKSIDSRCARSLRGEVVNPLFTYGLSHPYHLDEPTFIYICISFFDEIQVSKQNGPRWDAAFCGVTSRAILFAYVP